MNIPAFRTAISAPLGRIVRSYILAHIFTATNFKDDVDFLVKEPLPNVTFPLSRSFAGSITVNRTSHPNDTLFFWAFESEHGSLTADAHELSDKPWAVWLNGGYVT